MDGASCSLRLLFPPPTCEALRIEMSVRSAILEIDSTAVYIAAAKFKRASKPVAIPGSSAP